MSMIWNLLHRTLNKLAQELYAVAFAGQTRLQLTGCQKLNVSSKSVEE